MIIRKITKCFRKGGCKKVQILVNLLQIYERRFPKGKNQTYITKNRKK